MEERNVLEHVGPIVATEEAEHAGQEALADLDRRIRDLETAIGEFRSMKAQGEPVLHVRKTVSAHGPSILAKGAADAGESATVDEALRSLSVEQRIAVKSGLLRAGLLR